MDKLKAKGDNKALKNDNKAKKPAEGGKNELTKPEGMTALLVAFPVPEQQLAYAPIYGDDTNPSLLPINGIPLLTYALDFLIQNGATEIIVLVHDDLATEKINAIVDTQKQQRKSLNKKNPIKIYSMIVAKTVMTIGDALRDVDSRMNISESFIVMSAMSFIVGDIQECIENHNNRINTPKDSCTTNSPLMTILYTSTSPTSAKRTISDDTAIIYDPKSMEIHAVEQLNSKRQIQCDNELLSRVPAGSTMKIRYDLYDTGVYICSPRVLQLFSQSFDYMHIREDFIPSVLNKELRLNSLHCHIIESKNIVNSGTNRYAAYLGDPRTYFVALTNVLERWAHPIVPDSHAVSGQSYLCYRGKGVYQAQSVVTGLRCEIGPLVALSDNVNIKDDCIINHTFVGKSCIIGSECQLNRSILLDNVSLGQKVTMEAAFIGNNVKIGSEVHIGNGVIIGPDCTIADRCQIPPHTRLFNPKASKYVHNMAASHQPTVFEANSMAHIFVPSISTKVLETSPLGASILQAIRLPIPKWDSDDDYDDGESSSCESDDDELDRKPSKNHATAFSESDGIPAQNNEIPGLSKDSEFSQEIQAMTREGLENPNVLQNKILEMKSFRLASNRADIDVLQCILYEILKQMAFSCKENKGAWSDYATSHRVFYLCESFLSKDAATNGDFLLLWDTVAAFCQEEMLSIETLKSITDEGEASTEEKNH